MGAVNYNFQGTNCTIRNTPSKPLAGVTRKSTLHIVHVDTSHNINITFTIDIEVLIR